MRFPTISHQISEVVGKNLIFPTRGKCKFPHQIFQPSLPSKVALAPYAFFDLDVPFVAIWTPVAAGRKQKKKASRFNREHTS